VDVSWAYDYASIRLPVDGLGPAARYPRGGRVLLLVMQLPQQEPQGYHWNKEYALKRVAINRGVCGLNPDFPR